MSKLVADSYLIYSFTLILPFFFNNSLHMVAVEITFTLELMMLTETSQPAIS